MTEIIKSPCISVCMLDDNDICVGCFRSAEEITQWQRYSTDEKRQVVEVADTRAKQFNTIALR